LKLKLDGKEHTRREQILVWPLEYPQYSQYKHTRKTPTHNVAENLHGEHEHFYVEPLNMVPGVSS